MASLLRRVLKRRGEGRKRLQTRARRRRSKRGRAPFCRSEDEEEKIQSFLEWSGAAGLVLHPHLYIGRTGSCADIGVVAREDIPRATVLAEIPRHTLLNGRTSRVGPALVSDRAFSSQRKTVNSWVPLLLALLAEYDEKPSSYWEPYLSLVPSEDCPGPALQWPAGERERLLRGAGVQKWVERDRANIHRDYHDIVLPFMERHPELFKKTSHSLELYEQLVCFVMAYSFTDAEERDVCAETMMVPFVDLLNHHSLHHTELRFHTNHLQLVAVRNIQQGSEVMNTYGPLSNASLLHVYGFAEKGNPHDVALIQSSTLREVYTASLRSHDKSHDQRWKRLVHNDLIEDEFEVDSSGRPDPDLLAVVRLLLVPGTEYVRTRDSMLAGEEDLNLETLSEVEKKFVHKVSRASLSKFPKDLTSWTSGEMTVREKYARLLALGQMQCLAKLQKQITNR